MNQECFFKSVIEQDIAPVVICDLNHTVIYMSSAAVKHYEKRGGSNLVGKNLLECHNEQSCLLIKKVVSWFQQSQNNNRIHTFYNEKQNKDVYMIALRDDEKRLIGYYEKHEYRSPDNEDFYNFR